MPTNPLLLTCHAVTASESGCFSDFPVQELLQVHTPQVHREEARGAVRRQPCGDHHHVWGPALPRGAAKEGELSVCFDGSCVQQLHTRDGVVAACKWWTVHRIPYVHHCHVLLHISSENTMQYVLEVWTSNHLKPVGSSCVCGWKSVQHCKFLVITSLACARNPHIPHVAYRICWKRQLDSGVVRVWCIAGN